jgi:hypothetical protein
MHLTWGSCRMLADLHHLRIPRIIDENLEMSAWTTRNGVQTSMKMQKCV